LISFLRLFEDRAFLHPSRRDRCATPPNKDVIGTLYGKSALPVGEWIP
jgi:hypothetical protein